MKERYDNHEPTFPERVWDVYPQGRYVREVVAARGIARSAHERLHDNCGGVVLPDYHTLCHMANNLSRGTDIFTSIDELCKLAEEAARHPKCSDNQAKANLLLIEQVREQLPYIHDGMRHQKSTIDIGKTGCKSSQLMLS